MYNSDEMFVNLLVWCVGTEGRTLGKGVVWDRGGGGRGGEGSMDWWCFIDHLDVSILRRKKSTCSLSAFSFFSTLLSSLTPPRWPSG